MDDYIEYQIVTGEDQVESNSDGNSDGCIVLIIIAVFILWLIGKLFG